MLWHHFFLTSFSYPDTSFYSLIMFVFIYKEKKLLVTKEFDKKSVFNYKELEDYSIKL